MTSAPVPNGAIRTLYAAVIFVLAAALAAVPGPARGQEADGEAAESEEGESYRIDEVVIKVDQSSGASVDDINAAWGTSTLTGLLGSAGIYLLRTPAGSDPGNLVRSMATDPRLVYAEPNFIGDAPGSGGDMWGWGDAPPAPESGDGTAVDDQYAVEKLGIAGAHRTTRGAGSLVAVLDTGAALNHPRLAGPLRSGYDFVDDDPVPGDEGNGRDDDGDGLVDEGVGHGTHVAAVVQLVAPEAGLLPLRVLDSDGRGNVFVVAEAVLHAVAQGADVVNLSLGTPQRSAFLEDVLATALSSGTAVVAAAGNAGSDVVQHPAGAHGVLAVTATGPTDARAAFANFGSWIDVAAPGTDIHSAYPATGYARASGTSMAAAFVSGQAALIAGAHPGAGPAEITHRVTATARSLHAANPTQSSALGRGLPNIPASLLPAEAIDGRSEESIRCTGSLGAVEVREVVVPQGARCQLNSTRVLGDVSVLEDASLDARDVDVKGSLKSGRADDVTLRSSDIQSMVQLEEGGTATVEKNRIGSALQVTKHGAAVVLADNTVGNNIQVQENRGGIAVSANSIAGNLQCQDNFPAPTGAPNVVGGSAEKQCEQLAA